MPYFEKHNTLFIHIPKNAGSFVESSLGIPDSWDLGVGPGNLTRIDQIIERLKLFKRSFSNIETLRTQQALKIFGPLPGQYLLQHATLSEVLSLGLFDPSNLAQTFCFCIKRHPVARLISIYKYWQFNKKYPQFEDFCEDVVLLSSRWRNLHLTYEIRTHLRPQIDYMKLPDGTIPPWLSIIEIDDLTEFWQKQVDIYNWPCLKSLSHRSRNQTVKSGLTDDDISSRCLEIIHQTYSDDFVNLGYELPS